MLLSPSDTAPSAPPASRWRRFVVLLVVGVVLSNLIAIGLGVVSVIDSRGKADAMASQNARNLAEMLEQSLSSSARSIDVVLRALVDELGREEAEGLDYLNEDEISQMLARYRSWLPEIEGIRVYGADGHLRWGGAPVSPGPVSIADREYFQQLRDGPDPGLVVSRPVIGRVTKTWVVPFVRRYSRPDGRFAGVVVAIVPVEHLRRLLARPNLGSRGGAVLRYDDFGLIARSPPLAGAAGEIGSVYAVEQSRAQLASGAQRFDYLTHATWDGLERYVAGQRVAGLPFVVLVALASDDYLAQWRSDAWQTGIALVAFLVVSSASAVVIGGIYRRQQDDALRAHESNVRLAAAVVSLSDRDRALAAAERIGRLGVYTVELATGATTVSPPLRDIFFAADHEVLDVQTWSSRIHPDDVAVIGRFTEELMRDGRDFDQSYRIVAPDGSVRWVHGFGQMDRDEAGRPVSVHGAVQDITEYKRVEASLQNALAAYQTLVARIPVGIFSFRWQPDGASHFTYASPHFCASFGLPQETVLGTLPEVMSRIHPDDRAALEAIRLAHGDTQDEFAWEGRVLVDGATRWLSLLARPTRGDDGSVLWEGVEADITDRKQAEQDRSASEERYRLLLQYSPVGILQYDTDLKVVYCNLQFAHIMGTPHDYMLTLDCKQLKDQRILPAMRLSLVGGLGEYEGPYQTSYAGKELQVSMACAPLRDPSGAIVGGIGILQDITERARKDDELARYRHSLEALVAERTADLEDARAEAERLARVKSEFLANMSHEIRTPLNGVLGLARMGYRESVGRDKAQTTFERILSSGQLLLGIINDILDFSKIEAGKLGIEAIPVDLGRVIGDTLALMEARADEKGLTLRLLRDPSLPAACVSDPLRIGQILVNLLSNAIKFTDEGSVTLFAGAEGGELVLRISDTGIGMDPAEIEKVFAPFEQADNSTTRKFGGTGLGLTITHRIVGLMGGSMHADSVRGRGSCFEVRLPCVPVGAAPSEAAPEQGAAEAGERLAGLRVLVAEDNEVNQLVLEDLLVSEHAEVTLVGNGQEAIECVRERGADAFDVVLMDVQMPVMDGHTATRHLAALAPALPVIGQTAHALDDERAACLAAGMVDHIAKPVDPDRMIATILRHWPRRG